LGKRIAHIVFSCWLAIILVFGTTPMEFVHSFGHHKDTEHRRHQHGLSFENKHRHCDFLSFQLMPFDGAIHIPRLSFLASVFVAQQAAVQVHFIQRKIVQASLRGPPIA